MLSVFVRVKPVDDFLTVKVRKTKKVGAPPHPPVFYHIFQ